MSDLKKTIEEEYLINDVLKLIMEAQRLDEFDNPEDVDKLYKVAFDKLLSAPSEADVSLDKTKAYEKIFGFKPFDNIEQRINKINAVFSRASDPTQARTIPEIMNYLDVITMMYKSIYNFNPSTAGFLMEHVTAILVGGTIPPKSPIQDIEVRHQGEVIKGYSLKTYAESAGAFGGSFNNLVTFFKENPKLEHLSYVTYLKKKAGGRGSDVMSLDVKEKFLTFRDDPASGTNVLDVVNTDKLFSADTVYRQRYDVLKRVFLGADATVKGMRDFRAFMRDYVEQSMSDIDKEIHAQRSLDQVVAKLKELAASNSWNEFDRIRNLHAKETTGKGDIVFEALLKAQAEGSAELAMVIGNFIRTGKVPGNRKNLMRREPQFEVDMKKMPAVISTIQISKQSMMNILTTNADLLAGIVKETYETLDAINDGVNGFFRGSLYPDKAIRMTQKNPDKMVTLSAKFRSIAKDVSPKTRMKGAGSQLDLDT